MTGENSSAHSHRLPALTRRRALALGAVGAAAAAGTVLAAPWRNATAAPKASARPLVGATGDPESLFSTAATQLGAGELHYTFQPTFKGTWSQWTGSKCTGLGHLPLASTKWTDPTQSAFDTLVGSVPKDGKTRRICPWQEPEDNMDGATFTGVVKLLRNAVGSGTDILICLDLMTFSLNPASGRDVTEYFTSHADVIGWSVWPKGGAYSAEEGYVQKAAKLCDDHGIPFAVSSFILDGETDDAGSAAFIEWMEDFLRDRHSAGKPTDHVVAYVPDSSSPWLTQSKTKAAGKAMFSALRSL